jgi:hypothetical protein
MKLLSLAMLFLWMCFAQDASTPRPGPARNDGGPDPALLRTQRRELVKADHRKNVEDATELLRLAEAVKAELDKEDPYVISVKTMKETEDIERLAKSIHGRLKRY